MTLAYSISNTYNTFDEDSVPETNNDQSTGLTNLG